MEDILKVEGKGERGAPLLVVVYRGVKIALSQARVIELLDREQEYLDLIAGGAGSAHSAANGSPLFDGSKVAVAAISHARLSNKIKKVYDLSHDKKNVRPAHASILCEMIALFDWHVPLHPNTKLDQHLFEMSTWKGSPPDLKEAVTAFLERYNRMRR